MSDGYPHEIFGSGYQIRGLSTYVIEGGIKNGLVPSLSSIPPQAGIWRLKANQNSNVLEQNGKYLHFFWNPLVLVKKNKTILIVYKNELNHFVVCIRNSIFAAQKIGDIPSIVTDIVS